MYNFCQFVSSAAFQNLLHMHKSSEYAEKYQKTEQKYVLKEKKGTKFPTRPTYEN